VYPLAHVYDENLFGVEGADEIARVWVSSSEFGTVCVA